MKKILLLVILSISAFAANAGGVRSLDLKANLRHDFGLGVGVTFQLPKNFEIAPSLNFYFNDGNMLTTDLDFRYRFELPKTSASILSSAWYISTLMTTTTSV